MATNIPTVEEFNEELPVSSWDRNTVADGNWLQANTIGPLKNRDDKIIELLQDLEGASNSWKNWSEDHDTDVEGDNNYYIGSGNSAHGNSIIIGNGNESDSTSLLVKKHITGSHWVTDAIYSAQNFIVGNNNIAKTTRNAFIFGSNNYTETTEEDLDLDCDPNDGSTEGQNNDGYTLAFGLANSAIRNYDIAIGRGVLASGGENIVIGAPECRGNMYAEYLTFDTKSVGHRNINVRSNIDGHMNIAFESILSGYPYTANGTSCGPGLNVLYHSNVTYSGKPGTPYNSFDHNNFDDCSKFIFDFRDYGSPVISNIFKHITNLTVKNTQNGSSQGICYNDFFNLRNVNFSGIGKLNRNVLKNIEFLNLSGDFFNNYFDNLDNYSTETITVSQANNNLFKHFNGQVDFSARQLDNNIILHAAYNSKKFSIGAPIIHGNVFNELSFEGYIGDAQQYISAYGLDDSSINYNILYNVNSIKRALILPNGGFFLSNIMANTYGMYLSGYNNINNNIFNNISFSAGSNAVDDEHGDGIINENIFLNSYNDRVTKNKIIFEKIGYVDSNIIFHSNVSANYENTSTQYQGSKASVNTNVLLNSTATLDLHHTNDDELMYCVRNFVFNGELIADYTYSAVRSISTFNNYPISNNILFNTKAVNSHGSFAFGDGGTSYVEYRDRPELMTCNRVHILGQSYADTCVQCGIFGTNNILTSADRSFIFGEGNKLLGGQLGSTGPLDNENLIIGINNYMSATAAGSITHGVLTRNVIVGKNNTIKAVLNDNTQNLTCDNYFYGITNAFGKITDSYKKFEAYGHGATEHSNAYSAENNQRNFIIGAQNSISKHVHDTYIFGNNNAVRYNKNDSDTDETIISNNFIIAADALSIAGSNQFNAGFGNTTSGYFAMAIGEDLIAHDSQLVIGRFNAELDGTNGISADDINSTSGALFVIGNGRHKLTGSIETSYNEANIERSNAMVVSADGTVSAKTYKADPTTPLGKLFDFLSTVTLGTGNLHWDATTSAWSMQ